MNCNSVYSMADEICYEFIRQFRSDTRTHCWSPRWINCGRKTAPWGRQSRKLAALTAALPPQTMTLQWLPRSSNSASRTPDSKQRFLWIGSVISLQFCLRIIFLIFSFHRFYTFSARYIFINSTNRLVNNEGNNSNLLCHPKSPLLNLLQ